MHTRITPMIATMAIFRPKTFDKAAWSKTYNKERREWYKARGICTECGANYAVVGRVMCETCAQRCRDYKAAHRDADKLRRQKLIDKGLCARCGKRKPRPGLKTCTICAKRMSEYDRDKVVKKHMAQYKAEYEKQIRQLQGRGLQ